MLSKRHIQASFDRAKESYEKVADAQRTAAGRLVDLLHKEFSHVAPRSILDLGCGTGCLSRLLRERFPDAAMSLNDMAPSMLQRAQEALLPLHATPYGGDMEALTFLPHDLCVSNFAFQWLHAFKTSLERFFDLARVLAFACPLQGTFAEFSTLVGHTHRPFLATEHFPSLQECKDLISACKPRRHYLHIEKIPLHFASPFAFLHHLRSLGAAIGGKKRLPIGVLRPLLQERFPKGFGVHYETVWLIMEK